MRKCSFALLMSLLISLLPSSSTTAAAQSWPTKPIKLVISFGPGSASDAIARILAQDLTPQLGQPVVVIHKPGADGSLSGIEVQRSAPDGYTFLFSSNSALSVAPNLRKVPPYNSVTDFTPISLIGLNTLFFVIHPTIPAKTLAELVTYARANPGKLNSATGHTFGIVGTGLFAKQNGLDIVTIPYKSEPEAIVDVLSGRVQLMIGTSTAILGHVKDGKLRPLAATTAVRHPLLPDVPTFGEAGQKKFPFDAYFVVVGPAGLPAEIVERMNKSIVAAIAKDTVREQMQKHGVVPQSSTAAEVTTYLKEQHEIWKSGLRDAGIELQ